MKNILSKSGKISCAIICVCTLFLLVKKGFFVAVQEVGFVVFFMSFFFTIICIKFNIAPHQQEHVRSNFLERKKKRAILLLILVSILEIIAVSILYNHPYAFLLF